MKKSIFVLKIFIVLGTIFMINNVEALEIGRITHETGATLRKGPGSDTEKLNTIPYNDNAIINSYLITPSTKGCEDGWYNVNYHGAEGYVCSTYISKSTYTIKTNYSAGVNLRNGAGTNYNIYKKIPNNTLLTLSYTNKFKGTGCSNGWYGLNLNTYKNKYACSNYTKNYNKKSNVIVTTEENAVLKETTSSTKGIKINYGQSLTLSEQTLYQGKNCPEKYNKVYYKGKEYYICSSDILNTNNNGLVNFYAGINIRKGPGTNYEKKANLPYNTTIALESLEKFTGQGCSAGWYKLKLNKETNYICSTYTALENKTIKITRATNLNIRKGPSTSSDIIKNVTKNTTLPLQNTTIEKGTGCTDGWYKVKLNGIDGYVCSTYTNLYIKKEETKPETKPEQTPETKPGSDTTTKPSKVITKKSTNSGNYYTISNWTYRVNENYAYIRAKANTSSSLKDTVYLGTELEVTSTVKAGNGCSDGWYKVTYFTNKTGYICKTYVDKYESVTKTDSSYCNKLKKDGFPASYCPYLSYLHSKYPNWVFKAEQTGTTFLSAINGESQKNYTQITKNPYLASNEIAEAGGWRVASDSYIAFMLDPRNYLNEKNIFAFENLSYDEDNHTTTAVRAMVDGTYLDTKTYAGYFVKYGKEYNISPVHLAARAKQEGAANKEYAAVSGNVNTKWNNTEGYVCSSYAKITENKIGTVTSSIPTNIRSGAGTENPRISTAETNDTLILQDEELYKGTGCTAGWNKVNINGTDGYICSTYLKIEEQKNKKGIIKTSSYINIRSGAGTNYEINTTANNKDTFDLLSEEKIKGTGCTSGWYKIKIDGYTLINTYNFYNIGSYGSNPVLRGLATAAGYVDNQDGTPWNTREKAIKYGGKFIAEGYINKGQDTMYYQKFNTGPNNYFPKYTHQYMTNILAPASESLSTYRSYTELEILNKGFVFKIPVYSSMPSQITTHPPVTS